MLDRTHYHLERLGPGEPDKGPTISCAADLRRREFGPIRYIVSRFIAEGCTLLAGRPKLGKSWFALDVGLAVAIGGTCLGGSTKCDQGDVLYLALEDNERRLQSRIDKVLGTFARSWPRAFQFATEWPRANEGGLDRIRDWIEAADNPRLVIVDVLAMFKPARGERESMYDCDYAAVKGLQALAGEFRIAIVVVHHTRKSGSEAGDAVEKISGTLGLSGAADAFLVLDRNGQGTTLAGRGRDVEEVDAAISFDAATCRWKVLGDAGEVHRTNERGAILAALADATEPMSPADLVDATGMPNPNVRKLLSKMTKAGEIKKVGRGLYLHPDRPPENTPPPGHIGHKVTNLDDYRGARDGVDGS